jgi:hypothetical protein
MQEDTMRLEITKPDGSKMEYVPRDGQGSITVGRRPGNDVVLDDPDVSNLHLRIESFLSKWTFSDQFSDTGTYINGKRDGSGDLNPGDELKIGGTTIRLLEGAASAAPPAQRAAVGPADDSSQEGVEVQFVVGGDDGDHSSARDEIVLQFMDGNIDLQALKKAVKDGVIDVETIKELAEGKKQKVREESDAAKNTPLQARPAPPPSLVNDDPDAAARSREYDLEVAFMDGEVSVPQLVQAHLDGHIGMRSMMMIAGTKNQEREVRQELSRRRGTSSGGSQGAKVAVLVSVVSGVAVIGAMLAVLMAYGSFSPEVAPPQQVPNDDIAAATPGEGTREADLAEIDRNDPMQRLEHLQEQRLRWSLEERWQELQEIKLLLADNPNPAAEAEVERVRQRMSIDALREFHRFWNDYPQRAAALTREGDYEGLMELERGVRERIEAVPLFREVAEAERIDIEDSLRIHRTRFMATTYRLASQAFLSIYHHFARRQDYAQMRDAMKRLLDEAHLTDVQRSAAQEVHDHYAELAEKQAAGEIAGPGTSTSVRQGAGPRTDLMPDGNLTAARARNALISRMREAWESGELGGTEFRMFGNDAQIQHRDNRFNPNQRYIVVQWQLALRGNPLTILPFEFSTRFDDLPREAQNALLETIAGASMEDRLGVLHHAVENNLRDRALRLALPIWREEQYREDIEAYLKALWHLDENTTFRAQGDSLVIEEEE